MKAFTVKSLLVLFLGVWGLLVYSNSFHNSFHFDDYRDILTNPAIKDIYNIPAIWNYWPTRFVNNLSLALNYHWGQFDVFGYHMLSLCVHIGSSVMVWWLSLLTQRCLGLNSSWLPFFTAAIFLTHPLQTQAVNYLTSRAVLWAAFFYLTALSLYVNARLTGKRPYYVCAFASGALSMFCKETTVTLPLMICFYELYFLRNKDSWKACAPFLLLLVVVPLTWLKLRAVDFAEFGKTAHEAYAGGVTVGQYFLTQTGVLVTYIRLLLFPFGQRVEYDYPLAKSILEVPVFLSILFLGFVFWSAVKLRRRFKLAAFGIFWFFLTLLPESSLWVNQDVIYEHRLYLPMLGFCFFVTGSLRGLIKEGRRSLAVRILALLILGYSILTYQRNKVWENGLTLWDDAVRKSPRSSRAHLNRGAAHQARGNLDAALADYNMVIGLGPVDAVTLSNRGEIFRLKGDLDLALANFNLAIKVNPSYVGTYINRGLLYEQTGEFDQARADFSKAIELKPDNSQAKIFLKRIGAKQ